MSLFPETELDRFQAEAMARGLFALARADGMHEREGALVASFWAETGGSVQSLSALEKREDITPEEVAAALPGTDHRRLFLKTAVLLTLADGQVTPQEKTLLHRYASCLGLDADLPAIETEVKEYLLGHLAHIQNTAAVADVAKKLAL